MNKNLIEIVGISTCGTYPSWLEHTIASFYNHVDKIVVVNGGYDINDPDSGPIHQLKREHKLIEKLDINNKIIEYMPTKENIEKLFTSSCKYGRDECGRSGNMTFATKIAYNLPNPTKKYRWILKLDSDQILYKLNKNQLQNLVYTHKNSGFRFAQYADYYHDFEHLTGKGLPDEFSNDGSLFYKAIPNQSYGGQGSPSYINVDQHPIYEIRTSHMRRISPPDVDKYDYFFKRYWYHTFGPNSINEHSYNRTTGKKLTLDEISKIARDTTLNDLNNQGVHINNLQKDERIPYNPPLVCIMNPLDYINKGH